jgi:hypothetical protein
MLTIEEHNETKYRLHALQVSQQLNHVGDVRTRELWNCQQKTAGYNLQQLANLQYTKSSAPMQMLANKAFNRRPINRASMCSNVESKREQQN